MCVCVNLVYEQTSAKQSSLSSMFYDETPKTSQKLAREEKQTRNRRPAPPFVHI